MRYFKSQRRNLRGFTLIELLVVVGIIAILAAVVSAGTVTAIKYARRTKANTMCVGIQTAVQAYYTEYAIYPTQSGDAASTDAYYDATTDTTRWTSLTQALCGNINPLTGATVAGLTVPNTRSIAYLVPTRADLDTTYGILKNPFGAAASSPYFYLALDTDYSGVLGNTGGPSGKMIDFSGATIAVLSASKAIPAGVAVWCSCDQALTGSKSAFWAHTY